MVDFYHLDVAAKPHGLIVASGCGTGKTVTVLSTLVHLTTTATLSGPYKPILILAPAKVVEVWEQDFNQMSLFDKMQMKVPMGTDGSASSSAEYYYSVGDFYTDVVCHGKGRRARNERSIRTFWIR